MVEVAVVEALQPDQEVQGAFVPQGPEVQPDHVLSGQLLPPHQEVQGPEVHEPLWPQGPQPEFVPFALTPPKGP